MNDQVKLDKAKVWAVKKELLNNPKTLASINEVSGKQSCSVARKNLNQIKDWMKL
jgi:hypothetical protein